MKGVAITEPTNSLGGYEAFCAGDGVRVRRLLVAHFGVEVGAD